MTAVFDVLTEAFKGTPFEGCLWVVGGSVRDQILGVDDGSDIDLVLEGSAEEAARYLFESGVSSIPPVVYPRFGTALVRVANLDIELVTARKESYDHNSRKPFVEPATLLEDAQRRDFTVNTLLKNLHTGEIRDPLGTGLADLEGRILRTPLDPAETFEDDPLRMLRAVRFRWKLGLTPVEGLYQAIQAKRERLTIISMERIRDEFLKMLKLPSAPEAMNDLMTLGLFRFIAPEFEAMPGVEQGDYHHLDVWNHTLEVVRNCSGKPTDGQTLRLAALLHDVGKPSTRTIDAEGRTRFFGHESLGAQLTVGILRRLKLSNDDIEPVSLLVKNHMRLGSATKFSKPAARRLMRDLGPWLLHLLDLVDADANALKKGVRVFDLGQIKSVLDQVSLETPVEKLDSPLSGAEIMELTGLVPGKRVGAIKDILADAVIQGTLHPDDKDAARAIVLGLESTDKPESS
ncbi:MAG TPA: HD domain-containing protein [Fimbriimonadaceae bacterium]|nr:HD domain-containing protein [Fimbriimonadaceae bacterium]